MEQAFEAIASVLLPYWPAEPGPLEKKAQLLRELSGVLGNHGRTIEDAHYTAANGNTGLPISMARLQALGPNGHVPNLFAAAEDALHHAERVQSYADYCRIMRIFILAVAAGVIILYFTNPPMAALRLAGGRAQAQILQRTFLKRLLESFGKRERPGKLGRIARDGERDPTRQMNIGRKKGGGKGGRGKNDDTDLTCLTCGEPVKKCSCRKRGIDPIVGNKKGCPGCGRLLDDCIKSPCQGRRRFIR